MQRSPFMYSTVLAILAIAFAACVHPGDESDDFDYCVENELRIDRGLYGQLFNGCDTEDCTGSYAPDMEVRIYDQDPTPPDAPEEDGLFDWGTTLDPIARTESRELGMYEVRLEPGVYFACTNSCDHIDMSSGASFTRRDWASGPGGGNWWTAECDTGPR